MQLIVGVVLSLLLYRDCPILDDFRVENYVAGEKLCAPAHLVIMLHLAGFEREPHFFC